MPKTTLHIGTLAVDQASQPLYARHAGFFERLGIDAVISMYHNGPAIAAAIDEGVVDVGYSNAVTVLRAHDGGLPFRALFPANLYDASSPVEGLLSVAASSPIRTASDFEQRVVGVGGLGTIVPLCAMLWIDHNGGDSRRVQFVEVPFARMSEEVRSGRIDAAQLPRSAEPTLGQPDCPLRLVAPTFSALGDRFVAGFWFASATFAREKKDLVAAFCDAMEATARWAAAHQRESARVLATQLGCAPERIERMPRVTYGTSMDPAAIQPVIDAAARYGMLTRAFAADALVRSD